MKRHALTLRLADEGTEPTAPGQRRELPGVKAAQTDTTGRQCDPDMETGQGPVEASETPGTSPASQGEEPSNTGCGE